MTLEAVGSSAVGRFKIAVGQTQPICVQRAKSQDRLHKISGLEKGSPGWLDPEHRTGKPRSYRDLVVLVLVAISGSNDL